MTDKEKRILKDGVKNLIGKYRALEHGIIEVLENNILSFIDSLQEEPVKISSHSARRSFATINTLRNIPRNKILRATGHSSEKAFVRYICYDEDS